jgi:Tfp pilus assembly protein PilN
MSKVDFLPEDYMDKKAQQRTNVICLVLFFLVMAGVAGGVIMTEKRQKNMNDREELVKRNYVKATESLKQMETLEKKKEQMMQKATISTALMEMVPRSLLIALVTNDLPAGASLLEYNLVSKSAKKKGDKKKKSVKRSRNKRKRKVEKDEEAKKAEEFKAPEKMETTIEIEGLANSDLQVADLISNLNRSKLFKQVNLLFSEKHEEEDMVLRRFRLSIELDPNGKASEDDVALARESKVTGM